MLKENDILDKVVFTDSELKNWLNSQQKKWLSVMRKSNLKQRLDMIPYFSRMVYDLIKSFEKEVI